MHMISVHWMCLVAFVFYTHQTHLPSRSFWCIWNVSFFFFFFFLLAQIGFCDTTLCLDGLEACWAGILTLATIHVIIQSRIGFTSRTICSLKGALLMLELLQSWRTLTIQFIFSCITVSWSRWCGIHIFSTSLSILTRGFCRLQRMAFVPSKVIGSGSLDTLICHSIISYI